MPAALPPTTAHPPQIQDAEGGKTLAEFVAKLKGREDIAALRAAVNAFATRFPMPGFDVATMKYNKL